jgi:hypothetical protein
MENILMYLGRAHKTALTPPTHEQVDHTISPLSLLDLLGHDGIDHTMAPHSLLDLLGHDGIDHTMAPHNLLDAIAHNLLSHVGRTGVGDLHTASGGPAGTTRHDTLNHAGLPGIPAATGLQTAGPFTFVWAATNNVQGSGALAFVPKLAIFVSLAQEAGNTSVAMASIGFTTAAFNGRAVGGHFTTQGSSNQSKGVYSPNTIGGLSPIGAPAYNIGGFTQSLTCTVFSQGGGVSIQPSSAITMRTGMYVLG